MTSPFQFKTTPYAHQLRAFEASRDTEAYALLMEQRTGKTKVALDTAAWLHQNKRIDGLVIIAPNGVHRNWAVNEIPTHLPCKHLTYVWNTGKASGKTSTENRAKICQPRTELSIVCVNVEALQSDACFNFVRKFMRAARCMVVVDESQTIKTPGAARTKRVRALALKAVYRRILTGTPAVESPFDLYSQFAFLDPKILGHLTFASFKARYGVWEEGYNRAQGRSYPKLVEYQRVEELTQKIAPHSFRVRRDECADLPPKIYQRVYFDLSAEQRKVYDELRSDYASELADGRVVTAPLVLTRYLRLQQVASNYWPSSTTIIEHEQCEGEGCEQCGFLGWAEHDIPAKQIGPINPRLEKALELIKEEPGQVVVWARFTQDIDQLMTALQPTQSVGRYDGSISEEGRLLVRKLFAEGGLRILIANAAAAGRGINLSSASLMIYYSNSFSLEQRLQSEDRAESLTKKTGTSIIDLIATDTVDEEIVASLRDKESLSRRVAGDPQRKWL